MANRTDEAYEFPGARLRGVLHRTAPTERGLLCIKSHGPSRHRCRIVVRRAYADVCRFLAWV